MIQEDEQFLFNDEEHVAKERRLKVKMNKKIINRTFACVAIAGTILTMAPIQAFADNGVITKTRLYGSDRIETAIAVANNGWTTADTAILAPSADTNLVDALAAAPLAGKTSPILLTENNSLNVNTAAELRKLGVTKVFVVGAINQPVVDQLTEMGITPTVLKGADRTMTAAAIASKLTNPAGSFIVGYNALPDALSVASYAAANNYSILVANSNGSLPTAEVPYEGADINIIGGPTLVKDISGAKRIYGADRFATNQAVLDALNFQYNNAYIADGSDSHLVDALVSSSLAAQSDAPIVLSDTNGSAALNDVHNKLAPDALVTGLGGFTVVPDEVLAQVTMGTQLITANDAVTKAEKNKLQADTTAAQALVTALPDSVAKTALQARLATLVALETATAAVIKAEGSQLQADVTTAQALVTALLDTVDKTALQNRLNAIVVQQ